MNDNEIIKALECCGTDIKFGCKSCPYRTLEFCSIVLKDNAHDLINRQKAEIERYKGVIKILEKDVATAKSEAIKEFAEKLKATYPDRKDARFTLDDCYTFEVIDNLVKEMTEEKRL